MMPPLCRLPSLHRHTHAVDTSIGCDSRDRHARYAIVELRTARFCLSDGAATWPRLLLQASSSSNAGRSSSLPLRGLPSLVTHDAVTYADRRFCTLGRALVSAMGG